MLWTSLLLATASAQPDNIIVMIADGGSYDIFAAAAMFEGTYDAEAGRPQTYTSPGWIEVAKANGTLGRKLGAPLEPEWRRYDPKKAWSRKRTEGTLLGGGHEGEAYVHQFASTAWHADTEPDSAGTMSQMMTGTKTVNGVINWSPDNTPVPAFAELVHTDHAVGIVSSVPYNHATPAAAAGAHAANRSDTETLTAHMLMTDVCDVVMGAGHPQFDNNGAVRSKPHYRYFGNGTNWLQVSGQAPWPHEARPWTVVDSAPAFTSLAALGTLPDGSTPERVLGLAPVSATLQANRLGARASRSHPGKVPRIDSVPSLETMTLGALRLLEQRDEDSFFLMVEGGAADWAAHANQAGIMIEEMLAFDRTVKTVVGWIESHGGWDKNLLIVTADHGHLFQGVPTRTDPFPPITDNGAGRVPTHTWLWDNHSNHLVPVYARGAGSDALTQLADERDTRRGAYIQDTEIFDTMLRAWKLPDPRE